MVYPWVQAVKIYMDNKPLLSILICSNKAPAAMDLLLSSLKRQPGLNGCEVVFIDNGIESQKTDEIICELKSFPCARYIYEKTPGIWAARKTSYENAHGEWFFILDDDNSLEENAIKNLLSFIARHPEAGGICPSIVAQWEEEPPDWLRDFGRQFLSYIESGGYSPGIGETIWEPGDPAAFGPPGGGMVIRREVAQAFLESYSLIPQSLRESRLGAEDWALYSFVGRCGYAIAYVQSVKVFHHLAKERLRIKYLTCLNLRMAYAYGKLAHSERRLPVKNIVGTAFHFGRANFASPPFHLWALWLKMIRLTGFTAGLCQVKLER